MLDRIGRFYRCTRHIPRQQLLRRLSLAVKRRSIAALPRMRPRRNLIALPVVGNPPASPYRPRVDFATLANDGWWATQLNRRIPLASPVDWAASAIEVDADATDIDRPNGDSGSTPVVANHLQRLTFHYHEFIEALPPDVARRVVVDWIDHNPPFQGHYWKDSWNSYAISIRTVVWMQWWQRCLTEKRCAVKKCPEPFVQSTRRASSSQKVPDTFLPPSVNESSAMGENSPPPPVDNDGSVTFASRLFGSICEQVRFLISNLETDICGNHLIKNIRCLLWAGAFFTGDEADRWRSLGLKHLWREVARQFLADGMHFELSPSYHCQVVGDLLDCATVMDGPDRDRLLVALQPAMQRVDDLTHPDGRISLFSDGGLRMAHSPSELKDTWRRLGGGETSASPRSAKLPQGGYYLWRNSRIWLLIDCGPVCADALPAHGHADMLAFELDIDGKRWVVDNGVYQYDAGPLRTYERSAFSHNTLTVGSRDQCELIGSFRTGRRATATCESFEPERRRMRLIGSHRAFSSRRDAILHRRTFEVDDTVVRIIDHVDSPSLDELATIRFLFHPDVRFRSLDQHTLRVSDGTTALRLTSDVPVRLVEATWSPDFGKRVATSRLEMSIGRIPGKVHTTLELE